MAVPVYADRTVIGYIEDRTFIKPVRGSKHMLRQPPAWAIDADTFDKQVIPHCDTIIIHDREKNKEYKASVKLFDEKKGVLDRGFGRQYYLALKWWNTETEQVRML